MIRRYGVEKVARSPHAQFEFAQIRAEFQRQFASEIVQSLFKNYIITGGTLKASLSWGAGMVISPASLRPLHSFTMILARSLTSGSGMPDLPIGPMYDL